MSRLLVIGFLTLLVSEALHAQRYSNRDHKNVFGFTLIAGVNNSQLDGDYFTGFNKVGFYGGLRGGATLSARTALNVELLYSVKGSRIEHSGAFNEFAPRDRLIALSYAEVPILFKYALTPTVETGAFVEVGASIGRLIGTTIEEDSADEIVGTVYGEIKNQFNSNEISMIGGLGYDLGGSWGLTLRYSFGLSRIYFNPDFVRPDPLSTRTKEVEFLRNYHLSLFISYKIL